MQGRVGPWVPGEAYLALTIHTHHYEDIFLAYVGHHPLGDALEGALRQQFRRSFVRFRGGIPHANGSLREMCDKTSRYGARRPAVVESRFSE